MTEELTHETEAAAVAISALALNEVYTVRATVEPGVFLVECNITDWRGDTYDCTYGSRPDDNIGLGPILREWIAANPSFPIQPFIPPTAEEVRKSMPALTARQFRLGLVNAGISPSTVTATIGAMPVGADRDKAQIEWEFATTFNRTHPLIGTVGAALGLTDTQIDAMWMSAIEL